MDAQSLKYAKTHEWIHVEGDIATIGISDFAVKELTDLVFIDFPAVGASFAAGDVFGEVESVKAVSDLYAPVSGEIIEVNTALEEDLGTLSTDPFGAGWLVKLRVSDASGLDNLLELPCRNGKGLFDENGFAGFEHLGGEGRMVVVPCRDDDCVGFRDHFRRVRGCGREPESLGDRLGRHA